MQRKAKKFLSEALEAAELVTAFVEGRALPELATDKMFRSAVYFQFAPVGEAMAQLRTVDPEAFQRLTDCHHIVGFRNQILHGYGQLQDDLTWRIIEKDLPILKNELAELLAE